MIQSLKDRYDECCILNNENDQLKLGLVQSKNDGKELERQIIILRDEISTTNEYKEKFKATLAQLDEMLESRRNGKDM